MMKNARDKLGQMAERLADLNHLFDSDGLAAARRGKGKTGQRRKLCRKSLGRGYADLRPGKRMENQIGLALNSAFNCVDDGKNFLLLTFAIPQRLERIERFARLRNENRKAAIGHRRFAVAKLGGHVNFARDARHLLEPVFGDHAGVKRRAAGNQRQARRGVQRRQNIIGNVDTARRWIDVGI